MLLFNGKGDCLAAKLRPGNVHSAEDWEEMLLPEIERQQELGKEVVVRADAAFAKPEIYETLDERGVRYAIRLPANENMVRDVEELLTRPVGLQLPNFAWSGSESRIARGIRMKIISHHQRTAGWVYD